MVPGEYQHVVRRVAAQDVEVLVHRVRGAAVPVDRDALLRGQELHELVEASVEEAPTALHVPDQALRLVLRADPDAPDAGVDAVGEREIDDAELAAERHRRFRAPLGQLLQPAPSPSREDEGHGVAGNLADEPVVVLFHVGKIMQIRRFVKSRSPRPRIRLAQ